MRDPFSICVRYDTASNVGVSMFCPFFIEAFLSVSEFEHSKFRNAQKRLDKKRAKHGNAHIRGCVISNAYGEGIPHGAMPGKNYPEALLRRFSQQSDSTFHRQNFFSKNKTKNTQYLYMFFETRVQN